MSAAGRPARRLNLPACAVGVFAGCCLVHLLPALFSPLWLLPGLAIALLLFRRWPASATIMACALLMTGYTLHQAQGRMHLRLSPDTPRDQTVTSWLVEIPERVSDNARNDWRLTIESDTTPPRRLRLSWYDAPNDFGPASAGQCWQFSARLRPPQGMANPYIFDYEAWLLANNIHGSGYIRSARRCAAADRHDLNYLRGQLANRLGHLLADSPVSGIALALLLGERSRITDAQWAVLRHTGTSHLVAISGLHIGLMAAAAFWLVRRLVSLSAGLCRILPAQRWAALIAIPVATGYALLSGFDLPAQRALIMVLVALLALLAGRLQQPMTPLSVALIFVLLHDPFAPLAAGFWLSFAAVCWILWLLAGRQDHQGQGWKRWLWLQLGLTLALAPLCLLWFQQASWLAAPANLLLIPLLGLYLPLLIFAGLPAALLGIDAVLPLLLQPLALAWQALAGADAAVTGSMSLPAAGLLLTLAACLGIALLIAPRGMPARFCGLLLLLPLLWPWRNPLPAGSFEARVLDVGQGLAVVIRTRHHSLLYDTGPRFRSGFDTGEAIVVPTLQALGIRRLDGLIVSHADIDHRGGLNAIRRQFDTGMEINTGEANPCSAPQSWEWDGVHFRILHPQPGQHHWNDNNGSCVLQVSAGNHALLLPGDIERQAERALLRQHPASTLATTVLLAPHHGSGSSSSAGFVAATSPEHVIFAASRDNRWGFPKAAVRDRYAAAGSDIWQTGRDGALLLRLGNNTGQPLIEAYRQASARYWRGGN